MPNIPVPNPTLKRLDEVSQKNRTACSRVDRKVYVQNLLPIWLNLRRRAGFSKAQAWRCLRYGATLARVKQNSNSQTLQVAHPHLQACKKIVQVFEIDGLSAAVQQARYVATIAAVQVKTPNEPELALPRSKSANCFVFIAHRHGLNF